MKKQINPTIKAHLIRGAFYLLLLVAVCAIPFALAQRQQQPSAGNQSAANEGADRGVWKARLARRRERAAQATKLSGVHKAVSKPNADSRLLPYDVRSAPSLPRTSQVPLRNIGTIDAPAGCGRLTPRLLGQAQSRLANRHGQPLR